jgi:hypothetical protein
VLVKSSLIVLVLAAGCAACASNPAKSAMAVPLDIPEPPPRVAPDPVPAVAEAPPPEVPETAPPAAPAAAPPPPRVPAASRPDSSATPPVAQTPEPIKPNPPPELRPAGPAGRALAAPQVRERIVRTKQKLDSIDRRRLSAGKRADYDSAQRFLRQANDAVGANNLLMAESAVEKAETLADGLK